MVDLSALSGSKDYAALSRSYTIFGRVSPQDKQGLIEALRKDGHGVAMVGDGVNDIPALKAADCSIAMARRKRRRLPRGADHAAGRGF